MKATDWLYRYILPPLAWTAINALSVTLRVQSVGKERIEKLKAKGEKLVYVFWHGRQFPLVRHMSDSNICVMSSTSRDGILQANILKRFNYEIVFGSSNKSPVRALVESIQKMREGFDVAFAVDGPKGPIHKVKPGALYLAKKMNAPIIPASSSAYPAITLKSWDKYQMPKPWARGVLIFGDPFYPSPDINERTLQKECTFLENKLNQLTSIADAHVKSLL